MIGAVCDPDGKATPIEPGMGKTAEVGVVGLTESALRPTPDVFELVAMVLVSELGCWGGKVYGRMVGSLSIQTPSKL